MLMIKGLVRWFFQLAFFAPVIARLLIEEKTLREKLSGYVEYMGTVRSRLIPGIW